MRAPLCPQHIGKLRTETIYCGRCGNRTPSPITEIETLR